MPSRPFPTGLICATCDAMAFAAFAVAILPADVYRLFRENPEPIDSTNAVVMGVLLLILGLGLHPILIRVDRERFNPALFRRALTGMLSLLAGGMVLSLIATRAGGPGGRPPHRWLESGLTWITGLGLVLVLFSPLIVRAFNFLLFRAVRPNRMARLLMKNNPAGAIRLAEAVSPDRRLFPVAANLALAYLRVGRVEDARSLLAELERGRPGDETILEQHRRAVLDNLRTTLGGSSGSAR